MRRLCVLIGEGLSERFFLPSLLENKLGFKPLEDKQPHLFYKGADIFWHIPFPPGETCPIGGKNRLVRTETYRGANAIIQNEMHLLGGDCEIHYRIITDHQFTDREGQEQKILKINDALHAANVPKHSCRVHIVENEMECWYFAGMNEDAPYIRTQSKADVKRLLSGECERISDPKNQLKQILMPDLRGAIKVATVMGEHFDILKARASSKSFNDFITGLEYDRLI